MNDKQGPSEPLPAPGPSPEPEPGPESDANKPSHTQYGKKALTLREAFEIAFVGSVKREDLKSCLK